MECQWQNDIKQNVIWQNDIQQNDIQESDIQHMDIYQNEILNKRINTLNCHETPFPSAIPEVYQITNNLPTIYQQSLPTTTKNNIFCD